MTYPFDIVFDAAMQLLPAKMASREAKAELFAIGMQESRLVHRRQIGGPARGFWQFEQGDEVSRAGVTGVLLHPATRPIITGVLDRLRYNYEPATSYAAIEHNDILACCYARLLLWTVPQPLPGPDQAEEGWKQYMVSWRPGQPHPETWPGFYREAWA